MSDETARQRAEREAGRAVEGNSKSSRRNDPQESDTKAPVPRDSRTQATPAVIRQKERHNERIG